MTRTWCDSCNKELTGKSWRIVNEIPIHLLSLKGKNGYYDEDGMPISGRCDAVLLCIECWNRGWSAFLTQLSIPENINSEEK